METKKFKTATGYCHILPDNIIFVKNEFIGDKPFIFKTEKNKIWKIIKRIIPQLLLTIFFIYQIIIKYQSETLLSILCLILATFLIWGLLSTIDGSSTPIIERKNIKSVIFIKRIRYLTRSRFIVYFEDKNGKTKKRYILLPGSLNNGEEATSYAYKIMNEEGLIN